MHEETKQKAHFIFLQCFCNMHDLLCTKMFVTDGSTYYLGLVESSLNSGRRPKREVKERAYCFKAWFGSCRFWNPDTLSWSDRGCNVLSTSTATATHCRCNHTTAFGSHFDLVPNDLSFAHVETFFR